MFFVTLAVVLIRQLLVTSKFTWWFRGSTDSHGASEKKRCTWTRAATCSESPPSFEWEAMRSNKSPPLQHSMTRDTTSSSWKTYTLKGRGMKRQPTREVENLGVSHNKISCCQSSSVYTNNACWNLTVPSISILIYPNRIFPEEDQVIRNHQPSRSLDMFFSAS